MALPKFKSDDQSLSLLQTTWASQLDPVLAIPQNSGNLISNVILSTSSIINHGLERELQGWQIVRQRGNALIYDNQNANTSPDKTLLLISSSGVSVDVYCF